MIGSEAPHENSWLDKCPVCKSGKLAIASKKKLFGLVKDENIECNSCHAKFSQDGTKYRLSYVTDPSNLTWKEYSNKTLEEKEWKNIADGGLSDEKQKDADMDIWMTGLKNGNIPHLGRESPVILKKNEELILSISNVSLSEPRAVRTGGYGGPSIRVAKGVYFRVGGFKSQSHDEIKNVDQGTITLTNTRLVFSGSKRTVNIPLGKIISIDPYSDAIALRRESKDKIQYFTDINKNTIPISVSGRRYQEPFSGLMFKYIIEGLTTQKSDDTPIGAEKKDAESPHVKGLKVIKEGHALFNQGKYNEAIKACDEAISIDPQFTKLAWNLKGLAFFSQSKYKEANEAFTKAIEIDPKDAGAWENKGSALFNQGKRDEALQAYDRAIELNPQSVSAWANKGNALNNLGKRDDAIEAYDEAIRLDPKNAKTWNNKGVALKALGRTTEADAAFAKAKELGVPAPTN